MDFPADNNVLVGLSRADDAGVYQVSDDLALIQTVDFFTPVVDDPYWFGQIAAANALSDVYAMGGEPKTAMNLVGFPLKQMDLSVLRAVIQGGIDKIREAGAVLLGGHSVEDDEFKYGLSVTGFIHPREILTKQGMHAGDRLVITKPLGTGIVNTAIKGNLASQAMIDEVTTIMATLNRTAAMVMRQYPVHACTDITGFGLIGHLAEMLQGSAVGLRIDTGRLPVIDAALEFAAMGLVPGGAYKNRSFREAMVAMNEGIDPAIGDILYDPQTSGGLCIVVDAGSASAMVDHLKSEGVSQAAMIGEVVDEPAGKILVR
ncbi:selenide, water dikinase [Desulfosarcina ovata subsp. sediminis]|uniref:Selenide, water dikinase n=2 Tax=Desulfosarcina ovata TaxID=83564 RepID=A0A5K8AG57_9BACT|nr:selenide, water dikinase [Desulfosarcina ovata subsp. sediminis]BBO90840.1 selenide, water dikinase [Desulfosarcina ovata subsp. ovata]